MFNTKGKLHISTEYSLNNEIKDVHYFKPFITAECQVVRVIRSVDVFQAERAEKVTLEMNERQEETAETLQQTSPTIWLVWGKQLVLYILYNYYLLTYGR